jgi:hypothetical protein
MMMNNKEMEKQLESLNSLRNKLNSELDIEKKRTAKFIKNFKKDDLFPKPKKLTLWQKIKKVLNF